MKKLKTIQCDKCKSSKTFGLKWTGSGIGRVRCWDIPSGWAVTIPSGWLCPDCKKL